MELVFQLKKASETCQSRNTTLARGNSELRGKLADREQTIEKLKEKSKQDKATLNRHQNERKQKIHTDQKIKVCTLTIAFNPATAFP